MFAKQKYRSHFGQSNNFVKGIKRQIDTLLWFVQTMSNMIFLVLHECLVLLVYRKSIEFSHLAYYEGHPTTKFLKSANLSIRPLDILINTTNNEI